MNSKVLMLLYRFPPMGGSGVQRSLKFVKYLPGFGWDPIVVTATGKVDISQDKSLEREIPAGMSIFRIPSLEPSLFRPWRNSNPVNAARPMPPQKKLLHRLIKFGRKLRRILTFLLIPDEQVFWSLFTIPVGVWICLRHQVKVIFASARPFSCLVSAATIGKLCRIPVVMDIRDPLTDGLDYTYGGFRRRIDRSIEGNVLRSAEYVTTVNNPLASHYRDQFPSLARQRFFELPNGYDEEDFADIGFSLGNVGRQDPVPTIQKSTLSLVHVGQIYPGATEGLVDFLVELRKNDPDQGKALSVRLIGGLPIPEVDMDLIRSTELEPIFSIEKRVDHITALEEMVKADFLLILRPMAFDVPHMGAGKIYEYLRAGRPILAFGPDNGVIAEIVQAAGIGQYVSKGNERSAIEFIQAFVHGSLQISPDWEYVQQFDRRQQTLRLAQLFEEASKSDEFRNRQLI